MPDNPFQSSRTSKPFEAKYPGVCESCSEGFEVGDLVMFDGDDLVHYDSGECLRFRDRPLQKPCNKCFLVHAGECF